jgi:hypothetical protein
MRKPKAKIIGSYLKESALREPYETPKHREKMETFTRSLSLFDG